MSAVNRTPAEDASGHAMASGPELGQPALKIRDGGSGPILKYTGSSFPCPPGHSFTLTDLPPAWCSSCGCLRESGWVRPASYRPKERKLALVVSVSAPFLLSKAEVAKRCLPGRMSAKARPQSIMWSDRLTAEVTCITAASIRVPWPYGRFPSVQGGGPDLRLLADGRASAVELCQGELGKWNQLCVRISELVGLSLAWAILRSRCLCHSAEEICSCSVL